MHIRVTTLIAGLAALTLAAAGCGGDDDSGNGTSAATTATTQATTDAGGSASGGGEELKLSADPGGALKFDKSSLDAKAGKVTIVMTNPDSVSAQHAVSIEGNGVDEDGNTVDPGGTSTVSADLKPGTYTFYCPVDGHEAAGMKGTLTVK